MPSPPSLPLNSPDSLDLNNGNDMPPIDLPEPLSLDNNATVETEILNGIVEQTAALNVVDNKVSSNSGTDVGQSTGSEKSTSFFASLKRPKIITNLLRREASSKEASPDEQGSPSDIQLTSVPIASIGEDPIQVDNSSSSQQIPVSKRKTSQNVAYSATALSSQSSISTGTMSLSRRATKKSDTGFSSQPIRFSRKLLDAIGFDRGGVGSLDSIDDVADDSVVIDDQDDYNDAATPIYLPCPVHVFWNNEAKSVLIEIRRQDSVGEAIDLYLQHRNQNSGSVASNEDFAVVDMNNFGPLPSIPGDGYSMFKLDRNALASRIWLPNERTVLDANIKDGDELRIFEKTKNLFFKYSGPPESSLSSVEYSYDETVADVLKRIVPTTSLENRFGLFYRKMGLWLDERKSLVAYEFPVESHLELRSYGQEFLLRIQVPDCELKLTIKVIPSLTIADVESMISFNLKSKHVSLDSFVRGCQGIYIPPCLEEAEMIPLLETRKKASYALYYPSDGRWLSESRTLEESGLKPNSLDAQLQYKIRYYPMTIGLPDYMLHLKRNERIKTQSLCGKPAKSSMIQVLISENMLVSDVMHALQIGNPLLSLGDDKSVEFGLFSKGLEKLNDSDSAWHVIRSCSSFELFEYHALPRKYTFGTTLDEFSRVTIELDPTSTLEQAVAIVCRRFGLDDSREFSGFYVCGDDGKKDVLDLGSMLLSLDSTADLIMVQISTTSRSPPEFTKTNIWDEGPDTVDNISYSSGADSSKELLAGTLNKLVEKLTLSDENNDSSELMDFVKTFILTYKSFTTPLEFLRKLIERYHVPRQRAVFPNFEDFERQRVKVQLRVSNVLNQWTKKYAFDFTDTSSTNLKMSEVRKSALLAKHKLLMDVLEFTENVIVFDHPTSGKQLRKNILKLREQGSLRDDTLPFNGITTAITVKHLRINLFALDAFEVAKHFTMMEFDLFSKVMPYEFLNQAWTKKDAVKLAPNLIAITKRFNDIAFWITHSILEVKTVKARAKRFSKLIDIAGHLYKLNNFSTLMAFIAGFSKAAVNRLRFTAKEMSMKSLKKFSQLEAIMSAESSYKTYRAKLRSINPPCIPYIGVYLLDLTYMEDGNPDNVDGLINFAKRKLIHRLIQDVQIYQDTVYTFSTDESIFQTIFEWIAMPVQAENPTLPNCEQANQQFATLKEYEDHLFELSLLREPRGSERNNIE